MNLLEWDFDSISDWLEERDEIIKLNIKGISNQENLRRFALFIVKTLDHIADPTIKNKLIHIELFDIGKMMSLKITSSRNEEFNTVLRYV